MKKGYTLLEILVACGLLILVFVLAFGYLLPATKAAGRYRTRNHLQQVAMVAIRTIEEAAATTAPGGFSWSFSSPVAIAFNPVDRLQPTNAVLVWSANYQMFWWDEAKESLKETRWPPGPPVQTDEEKSVLRAKRLDPARMLEVAQQAPQVRSLADGVTHFEVTQQGSATTLIQPVTLTLEVSEPKVEDRPDRLHIRQTMSFRLVNQK